MGDTEVFDPTWQVCLPQKNVSYRKAMTASAVIGLTYRVSKKRLLFTWDSWALSLSMYSQCQRCTS